MLSTLAISEPDESGENTQGSLAAWTTGGHLQLFVEIPS